MANGTDSALPASTPATVVHIAREDRPGYDTSPPTQDPIATLVAADRDDVLANLQRAEATLREVFPEVVLALDGAPGEEFMIRATAQALGRLSIATRTLEDRVAEAASAQEAQDDQDDDRGAR